MTTTTDCPKAVELEDFLLGRLPEAEGTRLGEHVVHCPRCLTLLISVDGNDTLVEALRRGGNAPEGRDRTEVEGLIARLRARGPASAPPASAGTPHPSGAPAFIMFPCPHCGKRLRAKPAWAGKRSKCPSCQQPLQVPAETVLASEAQTVPPVNTPLAGEDTQLEARGRVSPDSAAPPVESPAPGSPKPYEFLAPAQQPDEIGR